MDGCCLLAVTCRGETGENGSASGCHDDDDLPSKLTSRPTHEPTKLPQSSAEISSPRPRFRPCTLWQHGSRPSLRRISSMAGRRLLDAAKLLNATRAVAKQHIALRSHQLDVYTKTSTLARAVKNQTDRVTVTARAAIALSQRFNEPPPSYTRSETASADPDEHIPRRSTVKGDEDPIEQKSGLEQDHHYDRSEHNAVHQPPPEEELDVKQRKSDRHPLPDGTIPTADADLRSGPEKSDTFSERPVAEPAKVPLAQEKSVGAESIRPVSSSKSTIPTPHKDHHLSSEEARKLQREAESQIPRKSADSEGNLTTEPNSDVFQFRSGKTSHELSSLPRVKIPKIAETVQGTKDRVDDGAINADVYYSAEGKGKHEPVPEQQAIPEQEEIPEGVNLDVFHSPKVARMLGPRKPGLDRHKELEMKFARRTPVDHTELAQGKDQDTFNVRSSDADAPAPPPEAPKATERKDSHQEEEDVQSLAQDIARDAENAPSTAEVNICSLCYGYLRWCTDGLAGPARGEPCPGEGCLPAARVPCSIIAVRENLAVRWTWHEHGVRSRWRKLEAGYRWRGYWCFADAQCWEYGKACR